MKRFFGLLILMLACYVAPARAWNCDSSLQERVDVGSKKPAGATAGDGTGQYYIGPDAPNPNDYYVCKTVNPKSKGGKPSSTLNQTQNQNQSQSQSQNQTSTSKATGGSVKNSGNSSNTNNNTNTASSAVTNSGNSESQSSAAATNNGNNANNSSYQSSSTYNEVKQNPGAYAPEIFSANPCAGVGVSAGIGTAPIAGSFGLQRIDKGCDDRATAILFLQAGNELAYAKVMCITPAAKRAHLSLDECKAIARKQVTVVVSAPAPAPAAPSINILNVIPTAPAAPLPTPVITTTTTQRKDFPNCSIPNGSILTNICKAELRDAARAMVGNPGAVLHIAAPESVVSAVKAFLHTLGVQHGVEWGIFDGQNNNLSLYLTWTEEVR